VVTSLQSELQDFDVEPNPKISISILAAGLTVRSRTEKSRISTKIDHLCKKIGACGGLRGAPAAHGGGGAILLIWEFS
jgi:hypothetical protein